MKDFMVFLALVVLGIVIVGLIFGFKSKAQSMSNSVSGQLDGLFTT